MTNEEIQAKLTEILVQDFHIDAARVKPDSTFRGTLGLDSLDAVDLVYLLCKTFGLPTDLHAFRDLHTVEKVVAHVAAEVARKGVAQGAAPGLAHGAAPGGAPDAQKAAAAAADPAKG
jgi:acyl carrier protein